MRSTAIFVIGIVLIIAGTLVIADPGIPYTSREVILLKLDPNATARTEKTGTNPADCDWIGDRRWDPDGDRRSQKTSRQRLTTRKQKTVRHLEPGKIPASCVSCGSKAVAVKSSIQSKPTPESVWKRVTVFESICMDSVTSLSETVAYPSMSSDQHGDRLKRE